MARSLLLGPPGSGSSWLLLAPPDDSWLLLASWLLMVLPGPFSCLLMTPPGSSGSSTWSTHGEPVGAMREGQEEPWGEARPGGARRGQEESGRTRRCQEEPGGAPHAWKTNTNLKYVLKTAPKFH